MAVHCDYCNEEASGRAFVSDDRSTSVAYCGVHRTEALKEVEKQKSKRDNAEVPNAATTEKTVVGVDTLPSGKTITHIVAEDRNGWTSFEKKALSDEEAERWANRLWDFLEPKVQKLIDKSWGTDDNPNEWKPTGPKVEPIMSPDGREVRGYTRVPKIGPPPDHLISEPKVDIMDRYGLWSDNTFNDHCLKNAPNQSFDRRVANEQLKESRLVIRKLHEELENAKREIQSLSKMQV